MNNADHTAFLEYAQNLLAKSSGGSNDWIWIHDEPDVFGEPGAIWSDDTETSMGTLVCHIHPHGNFRTFLKENHAYSHADAEFIANSPRIVRELLNIIKNLNTQ